jgi:folate-binding protein YgfZ
MIIQPMTVSLHGVAPLPHLGVIRAQGEEAASFLHGQLTQDFALLGPREARLAAFCNAKGRMLASFIAFRRGPDEILLVCSRDLLPAALKRLSMFVLRAKAKLSDASAEFALFGLAGDAVPGGAAPPWTLAEDAGAHRVQLYPADGQPRALWVGAAAAAPAGAPLSTELWQWGEVRSGVATISAPVAEAFVPQMLNYESVGGVNFRKGCYPGQEVVARSQFRGTLKRRAFIAHSPAECAAGQEVFQAADAAQPAGLVAQAAPSPQGGWDAIVSLQLSAAEASDLHLGAADGPPLSLQALPYLLLADI